MFVKRKSEINLTCVACFILSDLQVLGRGIEQILEFFLVDLDEIHFDTVLASIRRRALARRDEHTTVLRYDLKHCRDRSRNHAVLVGAGFGATYRVGFARARLTVSEHGRVVSLEYLVHQWSHTILVQLLLAYFWREHVIEREHFIFTNHDLIGLARNTNAWLMLVKLFAIIQWPNLKNKTLFSKNKNIFNF